MTAVQKLHLFYIRQYAMQFQKQSMITGQSSKANQISERIGMRLKYLRAILRKERGSHTYDAFRRMDTRHLRMNRLLALGAPLFVLKNEAAHFLRSADEMAEYLSGRTPRLTYEQKQDLISMNQAELGFDDPIREVHYILNEHYLGYRL